MKIPAFLAIAIAMSTSAFSQTSPPAAPTLTAGAEFKGLRFDWDTVPGATSYQLEYRAHQTGSFAKQGDYLSTVTSTRFSFPLHLFDWTYARYRLAACNSAGCTRSAEISVSDLRRDAVGYFKATPTKAGARLGEHIDLAADGYTLVATARGESTTTSGDTQGGAVYVFRRSTGGHWIQRARIATNGSSKYPDTFDLFASVSASGNTVAVSLPAEAVDATRRGRVDVYYWKNGAYTRVAIPRPDMDKVYGGELSESGYLLAISGVLAGKPVTAIYKSINGVWQNIRTVLPDSNCSLTITGDGKSLYGLCRGDAVSASRDYILVLSGSTFSTRTEIDVDYNPGDDDRIFHYHWALAADRIGDTFAVSSGTEYQGSTSEGWVTVYHRDAGAYSQVAWFTAGAWNPEDYPTIEFGASLSLSGDGHTMVIGYPDDYGRGLGPRAAPLLPGTSKTGAAYVYRLTDSWKLVNMVKPNYNNLGNWTFGRSTALSGTGKTLVLGDSDYSSSATGADDDWSDSGLSASGALYMY
jgi:hypothetical protein